MPKNCAECKFRLNKERYAWRCGAMRSIYMKPMFIGVSDEFNAEEERRKGCPLIEINDNIAKLIEVAR